MRIEEYPAQEPFSDPARRYHEEVMRRGAAALAESRSRELAYGPDPYQGVLLFPAECPDGRVLAFAHGGGWTNGYKEWMAFMAPAFGAAGVTFASIGYRLAPGHLFPAGCDDVARGLAVLCRQVGAVGGDPGRVCLGGHSAGGHYAALLAVRRDWQAGLGLPADVIRGCLPISGVYRFGRGSGLSMRPRFLGPEDAAVDRAASALLQVAGTPPPFLIAYGSRDFPHLVVQAREMAAALVAAGGEVEQLELADCDHFLASYAGGEAAGPWVNRALAFMEQVAARAATGSGGAVPRHAQGTTPPRGSNRETMQ